MIKIILDNVVNNILIYLIYSVFISFTVPVIVDSMLSRSNPVHTSDDEFGRAGIL